MKFKTILMYPPWPVKFIKLKMRPNQVKMPYETMSYDDLKQVGYYLQPLLDDNCNLFMWTTHTMLPTALQLVQQYGFKYHCLLTWQKFNGRPCWGFKRKTEFVIYAYKGKITVNQRGHFIPTLFEEKLTKHSVKPQALYTLLESNTPMPRLELFARSRREGWTNIGNELDGLDIIDSLKLLAVKKLINV